MQKLFSENNPANQSTPLNFAGNSEEKKSFLLQNSDKVDQEIKPQKKKTKPVIEGTVYFKMTEDTLEKFFLSVKCGDIYCYED